MLALNQTYYKQILTNTNKINPYLVLTKKSKYLIKPRSISLTRKILNSRPLWRKIKNKRYGIFTFKIKNLRQYYNKQLLFYNAKRRKIYGKLYFLFWTKKLVNLCKKYKAVQCARYICKRFIKIKRRYYRSHMKGYSKNLKYKRTYSIINQYTKLNRQNKQYQKYKRKRKYRVFAFKYKWILKFFRKKKFWWVKAWNSEQFKFHYTYKNKHKITTKYLRQTKKKRYTTSKHLCFQTFKGLKALQVFTQNHLSIKHRLRFHNYIIYKRLFETIPLKKQYREFFIKGSSVARDFNWGMRTFKKSLCRKRPAVFHLHNFRAYLQLYPTRYIKNPWLQSLLYTGRRSWINNKSVIKRFKNPLREKRNKIYHFFDKYCYPRREYGLYPLKKHFFRLKQILKKIILPFYGHLTHKQIKKISKKKVNLKSHKHDRNTLFTSQLERRLDVLVYRMNLAPTILQAKQFILYGSVYVATSRTLHTDFIDQLNSLFPLGDRATIKKLSHSIRPLRTHNKAMSNINHLITPKEVVHINPYIGSLLKAPYFNRKVFNKPQVSYLLVDTHLRTPTKTPWIIQKKRFMKYLPNIFSNKQFNNYSGVFTSLPDLKVLPRTDRIKIPLLHTLIN